MTISMCEIYLWLLLALIGCDQKADVRSSTLTVVSRQQDVTVHVAFGSDSVVTGWTVCKAIAPLNCTFPLVKHGAVHLPLSGRYLNATLAFDAAPGCGATKAELNLNNPKWYDIVDVSLVDGFNLGVGAVAVESGKSTTLGPALRETGNAAAFGVFPYGCDICVARQKPPCDIPKGDAGCKTGTQYNPDVPCQFQGLTKGGATAVTVTVY